MWFATPSRVGDTPRLSVFAGAAAVVHLAYDGRATGSMATVRAMDRIGCFSYKVLQLGLTDLRQFCSCGY
jgi:hypothetical protein